MTRKINTRNFRVATRTTVREVNRQIVLNLIREQQPISRAELARRMAMRRSALTSLVGELVASGVVYEQGTAIAARGRRPTLLYLRTSGRLVAAADVRSDRTAVALADFAGHVMSRASLETPSSPDALVRVLADTIAELRLAHGDSADAGGVCQGVGLVVPGMVDRRNGRLLYAPRLGWRDVELRDALSAIVGLPVLVESAPIACALARLWMPSESAIGGSFAYVSVSDGVGVGLVVNGDVLRGEAHTAGEFGHIALDPLGPPCACGKRGCWEAFASNGATLARYEARRRGGTASESGARARGGRRANFTIEEVIRRARVGEHAAADALADTGREIGRGLAAVVSAFNPGHIYVGGEVTAAWDLLEAPMREALVAGSLTAAARSTPIVPDRNPAEYRLLGAVALVAAPTYAAPRVG